MKQSHSIESGIKTVYNTLMRKGEMMTDRMANKLLLELTRTNDRLDELMMDQELTRLIRLDDDRDHARKRSISPVEASGLKRGQIPQ